MKEFLIFFQCILCFSLCGQTYHKEYNNTDDETTSENILKIFEHNDTTIILGYEQNINSVYFNLYIDKLGNQIKKVYRDTSLFKPSRRFRGRNNWVNSRSGIMPGQMLFNVVNDYGKIVKYAEVDFSACGLTNFYLSDFLETHNRFIISGVIDDGERSSVLIFMDHDFNIIDCKFTDNTFKDIPSIIQTEDQRIFGIMAFTGYDMVDCGTCFNDARFYLAELSEESFFDTIKVVYEGSVYIDYKLYIESLSDNNILIAHELESSDPYLSFTGKLVLKSIDQKGNVNWAIDPLDINYGGFLNYGFSTDINDRIVFTCETAISNDIGFEGSRTSVISFISIEGKVLWTKQFLRFVDDIGWTKLDLYRGRFIVDESYVTFLGGHVISFGIEKPLLLRVTLDGCFHEDCRVVEATDYFPPPRKMISHRNIWNIHNIETNERYRYSFIEQAIPDIGGTLIRSDEMDGDNWYLTDRKFWGGERATAEHGPNGYFTDSQYHYDLDIGEYNDLTAPPEFDFRKLVVTEKDTIYFNDGRPMKRLTLECFRDDDKMDGYEPITWIELLGDPDHLFDTHNACRTRGSEVVTCFYSTGDLMWSHPDYTDCAPTGVEYIDVSSAIVYPNPANDVIRLNVSLEAYKIVSSNGHLVMKGDSLKEGEVLDLSNLEVGNYYIYETSRSIGKVIPFIKI